jgi:hypothetical protein
MTRLAEINANLIARLTDEAEVALSIHMPVESAVRDVRAPKARLRNLVRTAERRLQERGLTRGQCETILDPVRRFAAEVDFAHHRDPGLALHSDGRFSAVLTLAETPPELVSAGRVFHIKPLLPALARARRLHCLAAASDKVRLFSGTPFSWTELRLEPPTAELAANRDSEPAAGFPKTREPLTAKLLTSDLVRVAEAVAQALGDDPAPLVVVAEPGIAGHFPFRHLSQPVLRLEFNPFALDTDELWRRAADLAASGIEDEINDVVVRAEERLQGGELTASRRPEEILAAAYEGRVDTVLVASDAALWGQYNLGQKVRADGGQTQSDEDLLNRAAVVTLRLGGRAYAIPQIRLPLNTTLGTQMAALFRF